MKGYLVSYTETNVYSIIVQAESEQDAEIVAERRWEACEDDFTKVERNNSFFQSEGEVENG